MSAIFTGSASFDTPVTMFQKLSLVSARYSSAILFSSSKLYVFLSS